jgi:hypothetical protein
MVLKSCKWNATKNNFVDWDAHLAAIRKTSFSEKHLISKHNFKWLPTGQEQNQVDASQSTVCPSCQSHDVEETESHLQHHRTSRLPVVGEFFNQLQEFHEAEHTCPILQDTLFNALKFEIFGHPPALPQQR